MMKQLNINRIGFDAAAAAVATAALDVEKSILSIKTFYRVRLGIERFKQLTCARKTQNIVF